MYPGLGERVVARPTGDDAAAPVIRSNKGKIWIDLDNSPHVPFFAPIIEELQRLGYSIVLTGRRCFQVPELAELLHLDCTLIGRHSGKNKARKIAGLFVRAAQLLPTIVKQRPDLAMSNCSRSQLIVSTVLGIPSLFLGDYEFATGSVVIHPTWHMCPEVIPAAALRWRRSRLLKYPGIKEDVYVSRFAPDPGIRRQLGLNEQDLVVTVRPPAREAHYHTPLSDELFDAAIRFLSTQADVKVVVLPRNKDQAVFLQKRWPALFATGKMRIPSQVVNGLNLIWHSDVVISAGGTMNREAAALGVPVYSVFGGKVGAVDQYLSKTGRLVLLDNAGELPRKIRLVRRDRPAGLAANATTALKSIVAGIVAIMDSRCAVPQHEMA